MSGSGGAAADKVEGPEDEPEWPVTREGGRVLCGCSWSTGGTPTEGVVWPGEGNTAERDLGAFAGRPPEREALAAATRWQDAMRWLFGGPGSIARRPENASTGGGSALIGGTVDDRGPAVAWKGPR